MNAVWFDALARAVSRRQVLGLLGGGLRRGVLGRIMTTAAGAGTLRPHAVAAQDSSCEIKKVTIWLNAFIPGDLPEGVTEHVPMGPFAGQTMIPGLPWVGDCFLTDQRDFSDGLTDSARMHSEITIDVAAGTVDGDERGTHTIGETFEIDCEDGEVECNETASTDDMEFSGFKALIGPGGGPGFSVELKGTGANPCFTITPRAVVCHIDYKGTFTIELNHTRDEATVTFDGWVDAFPAYEAYAVADGGAAQTLFRQSPAAGTTPKDLCDSPRSYVEEDWHPTVPTGGSVVLRCEPETARLGGLYQYQGPIVGGSCGMELCTSNSLSFRIELAETGRVEQLQMASDGTREVTEDVAEDEGCAVTRSTYESTESTELSYAMWSPWNTLEVMGAYSDARLEVLMRVTVTEYLVGPICTAPTAVFEDAPAWWYVYVVDASTLALCWHATPRDQCLATPLALLTRQ